MDKIQCLSINELNEWITFIDFVIESRIEPERQESKWIIGVSSQ